MTIIYNKSGMEMMWTGTRRVSDSETSKDFEIIKLKMMKIALLLKEIIIQTKCRRNRHTTGHRALAIASQRITFYGLFRLLSC